MKKIIAIVAGLLLTACQTTEQPIAETKPVEVTTAYTIPDRFEFDAAAYRRTMHSTWFMPMRSRNSKGVLERGACLETLLTDDINIAAPCVKGLEFGVHSALFDDERMSPQRVGFFFEQVVPFVIENDAWLNGSADSGYARDMQGFYMAYALYGDVYGVSDEMDTRVGKHFERFAARAMDQDHRNYSRCAKNFPATLEQMLKQRPQESIRQCSNSAAAEWIKLYTAMGIVAKRPDFVDEAFRRLDSFVASSFEGGITDQAMRSGDAAGYLMQTGEHLDDTLYMMHHYLGVDVWNRASGRWNNTPGMIMEYNLRVMHDHTINIEYARVKDVIRGRNHHECCAENANWKSNDSNRNDPAEIRKNLHSYSVGMAYSVQRIGDPELSRWIRPTSKSQVWRSFNSFYNKIVAKKL